ncbi:MAG TPA: tetratricopeptide repeat protein [Rhizomicrobium sp.]|nr:tetratricopeptide repeat protein [Rhizomicrobium sp.]
MSEERQDRAALRARLMNSARAMAQRDGVEAVTLGKVAGDAGVPRAAAFGQFARKEDLLMSIVSEDLASLARSMRDVDWPAQPDGETPQTAVVVPLHAADTAGADVAAAPVNIADLAEDTQTPTADAPPADAPASAPRPRLARRADLAQVLESKGGDGDAKEPAVAEPAAPRTPDAWLERRLRVFERSMTVMEARQDQVEKNNRAAAGVAEETIKALEATIRELRERADAAEAKAKTAANEVRAALNETALRLQTVEGVARAALAENYPADGHELEPVAAEPVTTVAVQDAAPEPAASVDAAAPEAPKSFIAGVRQSVVAASVAAATADAVSHASENKGRKNLTRYLLGGLVVLAIFVAAAGMAFSKGVSDGRRDAMRHAVRLVPHLPGAIAMAQTPLDRLTARAEAGDAAAQLEVALRYRDATPQKAAAAFHWMTLAAVHGRALAQYLLGTFYAQGDGVPADAAKALQWYEAAALQGNRKAMHDLAIAYAQGAGTPKSPSEAVRWFSRAASLGYVDSEFDLAVLYERGAGVPQSLLDAYKWYAVAGRQGDAESRLRLEALRTQLDQDDLAAAQHAADAFRPAPYDAAANGLTRS